MTAVAQDELTALADRLVQALPGASEARTLVIAGSGLGGFINAVQPEAEISYQDLPSVGGSTVAGHAGKLIFGYTGNNVRTPLLLMAGRRHLYEGLSPRQAVLLPQAIFLAFPNLKRVIISNAAGGLNPRFAVGDLMLISDHINWMFQNPLTGPNNENLGPRFPDASDIYSRRLRGIARNTGLDAGINLQEGVYVAMHGPSYETRAEVMMLRHMLSADAVGMSTVPEALAAAHAGREVLGISFISNLLEHPAVTSHEEVVANAAQVEEKFERLILAILPQLHDLP